MNTLLTDGVCICVCVCMWVCVGVCVCQYIIMLRMDERDESHSVAKATDRAVNTLPLTHLSTIELLSLFFTHTHRRAHTHTCTHNLSLI